MTRDELNNILDYRCWPTAKNQIMELVWGRAFDGLTEKITAKDQGEDHATTKRRLKMAHDAIKVAVDAFEAVNMWEEGDCGSKDMNECLKNFLPIPVQIDTTKSVSLTSAVTEKSSATQPQPIATAPKERRILVYCQRAATSEGWWQIGQFDQAIGEWLDDVVDGELLLVKPTCWLPLPPTPTQPQ